MKKSGWSTAEGRIFWGRGGCVTDCFVDIMEAAKDQGLGAQDGARRQLG